jgi:hypothetical protein
VELWCIRRTKFWDTKPRSINITFTVTEESPLILFPFCFQHFGEA